MVGHYDHGKFTQLVQNLERPRHNCDCDRDLNRINKTLWMHFNDVWHNLVVVGGYDPRRDDAPYARAPPWVTFAYYWSKVWAEAKYMSLDQLAIVKALASREVEWLRLHPRGWLLTSVSFMYVVMAQLNNAIAVAASQVAGKAFIDLMLSRERRHALAAAEHAAECAAEHAAEHDAGHAAEHDAEHRTEFAVMVADLPSNTLKLIGEALLKILEESRMRLAPTGH
jgi:hypothetical protein